ncbi:MAG: magnesium transporter [Geodermatophilaceae bacterium]|nr:magnesium transporter [Geodermatophilaceae bacterium]MDQ3465998.1 CBS domain-containing protein [Actinomycetota bacterium]
MAKVTRVFCSRLSGVAVFDPNGDQIGKVRDVVVTLRLDYQPPRTLGLVVEIQQRRRIFLPIDRVTSFEADAVLLGSGTLNLKRFEQRPRETLVLAELLDRRVALVDGGAAVSVSDAAIEQARNRDWLLTRLAVRDITGKRITRRGHVRQVEWDAVTGLSLSSADQGAHSLLAVYEDMKAADVANALRELPAERRQQIVEAFADERLADVLEELPEEDQVEIIGRLHGARAGDVLEAMDPDDAADLLAEFPAPERERLLALMEPEEAKPVRRLMAYSEDTAGGLMTSEPVILPPDATIAEALARVREPELSAALATQVYVVRPPVATPTGTFLGLVHIQRLLREPPSSLVSGIIDDELDPLTTGTSLPQLTRYFATYNLVAAPVVDAENHLVGAVTVDDLLDSLLPEDWREDRE